MLHRCRSSFQVKVGHRGDVAASSEPLPLTDLDGEASQERVPPRRSSSSHFERNRKNKPRPRLLFKFDGVSPLFIFSCVAPSNNKLSLALFFFFHLPGYCETSPVTLPRSRLHLSRSFGRPRLSCLSLRFQLTSLLMNHTTV